MDSTSTAGATPPAAPGSYPVFAAVAVAITGRGVYDVIDLVGGIFEGAGAVFEGSPDAPGTLLALLPPSDDAAIRAIRLGLQAQATAPAVRLGIDATEVHAKKEQDARWQQVIDSVIRLQKAARTGEAIAGDGIDQLSQGAAATRALQVGDETFLLLTGLRELSVVPDPVDAVSPATAIPAASPPEAAPDDVAVSAPPTESPVSAPAEPVVAEPVVAEPVVAEPAPAYRTRVRWDAPLVGRDAQLTDLTARLTRAITQRVASCVLITGEVGSGRTRLVRELVASTAGVRTLAVTCAPADSGGARWPLAAIVEALADLDAFAPPEAARTRLAELFAGQHDADRVVPQLLALLAIDGAADTDRVRWALRRLLEVALKGEPTVLHIDDADRAGGGFLRLLADITTAARDVPLLIAVTTTRESEGLPAIRLGALTPAETATLVRRVLGPTEPELDAVLADRLPASPFAIELALTLLTESGTLAPGQGAWMAMADLARVPIPDTTVGLIRQRLQTLLPQELIVLGMAAVAGEVFEVAPLLEVVPDDVRAGVAAALTDLVERGYLVGDPGAYAFRHPSFREATMPGVPAWAQASAHERAGRALELRAGERLRRSADTVGYHLEASCRLRADAPPADRTDALKLLTWSATAAVAEGDLEGAARLERLAGTLVDDPIRRAELLYVAAEHGSLAAPDRPADREIAEAALAASIAGDDVDWRVRLLRARLRTAAGHEDALETARSTADDAIASLPEDERSWALSSAWALRGMVHAARSQNGLVAEDLGLAADNAAGANRTGEETAALRGAATALLDGPLSVAEAEARCTSFLTRVQGPLAQHDVRSAIALLRARRGDFDDARRSIAASIADLDELGAAADLAITLHRAAQIEVLAGQRKAAEPQMQRALAAATHARDDVLRARLAAAFAHLLVTDDDRLDEALALADVAEAHAADMTTQVGWRMARARVLVRRGRGAQAERLVREGLGIAEQTDSTDLRANALLWAADVRRRAGRPSEAEPFERRALRLFERRGATAQAASAAAALSQVAEPNTQALGAWDTQSAGEDVAEEPGTAEVPTRAEGEGKDAGSPPDQSAGASTRLADEMMAMLADSGSPADPEPDHPVERPTAQTDPGDELLEDPTHTAEGESQRRWFNR